MWFGPKSLLETIRKLWDKSITPTRRHIPPTSWTKIICYCRRKEWCWIISEEIPFPPSGSLCRNLKYTHARNIFSYIWPSSELINVAVPESCICVKYWQFRMFIWKMEIDKLVIKNVFQWNAQHVPKILSKYAKDISKICTIFLKDMLKIYQNYVEDILNICPRISQDFSKIYLGYAKFMPKICLRYFKDMPKICPCYAQNMFNYVCIIGLSYVLSLPYINGGYSLPLTRARFADVDIPIKGWEKNS